MMADAAFGDTPPTFRNIKEVGGGWHEIQFRQIYPRIIKTFLFANGAAVAEPRSRTSFATGQLADSS